MNTSEVRNSAMAALVKKRSGLLKQYKEVESARNHKVLIRGQGPETSYYTSKFVASAKGAKAANSTVRARKMESRNWLSTLFDNLFFGIKVTFQTCAGAIEHCLTPVLAQQPARFVSFGITAAFMLLCGFALINQTADSCSHLSQNYKCQTMLKELQQQTNAIALSVQGSIFAPNSRVSHSTHFLSATSSPRGL